LDDGGDTILGAVFDHERYCGIGNSNVYFGAHQMKDKFIEWFGRNRKTIGYSVGGANIVSSIVHLSNGQIVSGVVWLIVGSMIIFDTYEFK
jgi:hypothetical protein